MLDSLSFLHSSPPVFSSANTVYPSFLYFMMIREREENDWKLGIWREILISQSDYLFSEFSARVQIRTPCSTFLYSKSDTTKDTKPAKKRRENRSWVQWAMLARPTIFFPLLLGWVQFLSFLILMTNRRTARVQFKPKLPTFQFF